MITEALGFASPRHLFSQLTPDERNMWRAFYRLRADREREAYEGARTKKQKATEDVEPDEFLRRFEFHAFMNPDLGIKVNRA